MFIIKFNNNVSETLLLELNYEFLRCKILHSDQYGYVYKVWRCFLCNERDDASTRSYTWAHSIFTLWPEAHMAEHGAT